MSSLVSFQAPGLTAQILILYLAFWAMATGILRIILAMRLRKEIDGELWMALSGLAGIAFGLVMVARPGVIALTAMWLVGYGLWWAACS